MILDEWQSVEKRPERAPEKKKNSVWKAILWPFRALLWIVWKDIRGYMKMVLCRFRWNWKNLS